MSQDQYCLKTGILLDSHKEQNYTWYELVLDPGQKGFKFLSNKKALYRSGSQLKVILNPRGYLAMSSDIFGCHNWGQGYYWHLVWRGQGCF